MDYKSRVVEYAQWGWGRAVPYFCAATRHHEMELIRLVNGNGEIHINGEKYELKKDRLYIVRSLVLHSIRKTGEIAPVVDFVKADLRLLAQNCPEGADIREYLHFFNDKNSPSIAEDDKEESVIAPLFDEHCSREQMQRAVYNLLKLLYKQRKNIRTSNIAEERRHYAAQNAVEYLTANYTRQVKIADVAAVAGYDEFYTMKLFKHYCGWSIVDYLNGLRVTEAKRILEQTDEDVRDVAVKVGYKSGSYFDRQFKKIFGITPSELRAQKIDNKIQS